MFTGYFIDWVNQESRSPAPLPPKYNKKFEILLVKIFNLKQKQNQLLLVTLEKIKFLLLKKTVYGSFR